MKIGNNLVSDNPVFKKIGNDIIISEYESGQIKYVNIAVDRSRRVISEIYTELVDYLLENNLSIANQFLFGTGEHESENKNNAEKYFKKLKWPVTVIKQESLNGGYEWGTIITAISTNNLRTVSEGEKVIGNFYEDEHAAYFLFGGLIPQISGQSNILQSRNSFDLIESYLKKVDMDIYDIARTWFYLDDLLSWYDDFNSVRNEYFTEKSIFERMIPASTGIGAGNLKGSPLLFGGYALKGKLNGVITEAIDSPLQCPAPDYKSSFSRAVETMHPDYRHLMVSGTASITPEGETAHIGDIASQIELTMKVVYGILRSREMSWESVTRGIVYVKNKNDMKVFDKFCSEKNLKNLPLSIIQADVCREELLFEIEVDAIKIIKNI